MNLQIDTKAFMATMALSAMAAFCTIVPSGFIESKIATGFNRPTQMEIAPDGRVFVLEQGGTVRIVKNGTLLSAPFITLGNVFSTQDYGLLGIAFDPNFAATQWVYLFYGVAGTPTYTHITRVTANGDAAVAGSETEIFRLDDFTGTTHQGGALHFGKDGKLYVFSGTPNGDPTQSQNLAVTYGKVLRINSDGSIPSDNPFYGANTGRSRAVYCRGLRNPFTASVQSTTGRIFINDNGQDSWEEINEVAAGANYGWPSMEGNVGTQPAGYKAPFYTYAHSGSKDNSGSVVAAAFYNPATAQFPAAYIGKYFYADHVMGIIDYVDPVSASPSPIAFATGIDHPLDIKFAADGSMFYLTRGNSSDPATMNLFHVQFASNLGPVIDQSPNTSTYPVGEQAVFCVSASGSAPLAYQWQRNAINLSGANGSCYTTPVTALSDNGAQYRVVVSNPWGSATSNSAILNVTSNRRPLATITAPSIGSHYDAGNTLSYAGTGTDPDQGGLGASAFTWWINFHHNTHAHTALPPTSGAVSGSLPISVNDEKNDNVWFRVHLRVTDAGGLSDEDSVDVLPNKTMVTINSAPAGLPLNLDGGPIATPFNITSVVGIEWNLSAPATVTSGTTLYRFVSWSDGLAADHKVYAPAGNPVYTANYAADNSRGSILRQVWNGITGATVASLTSNAAFPNSPSSASQLSAFEGPTDVADNYGARIVGLLYPPATGAYTFWIAGDDNVELWLGTTSSPASKAKIAYHNDWTTPRQWTKLATQKSAAINLTAGQKYYIEALHKEAIGGDNVAVAWSGPGIAQQVIPGAYLSNPDAPAAVPAPWANADIGGPALAGSATYSAGTFAVTGGGADIWGAADQFQFVYQSLNGDGEIRARIDAVQATDYYAKAGLMIRESSDPSARNVMAFLASQQGAGIQARTTAGGTSANQVTAGMIAPYWLRLTRSGGLFTAYRSQDGSAWTSLGQYTVAMNANVQVGLAVTAHNNALLNTSSISNVSVTTGPVFSEADIGAVGLAGSHTAAAGVHTVRGSGADVWGTADAFHFTYTTLNGDGEIRARVAAVQNTNVWAKAGVMMREGLAANARNLLMALSATQGTLFQRRLTVGGATTGGGTTGLLAPYWVRLVRAGNVFSAYRSADGVTWTLAGQETLALAAGLQVGLAVSSHDNAQLGSGTFDNVKTP